MTLIVCLTSEAIDWTHGGCRDSFQSRGLKGLNIIQESNGLNALAILVRNLLERLR